MSIAPQILRLAPELNDRQLAVVEHADGPLLVRAGPGTGKTRAFTWRSLNLLLRDICRPQELLLLAFGQPVAEEMKSRVLTAAERMGRRDDASAIRISTIHSLCHRVLARHHRRVGLSTDYRVLNKESQRRFLLENFDEIFGPDDHNLAIFNWRDPTRVAQDAARFFDRITEEDISPRRLVESGNLYDSTLGRCYLRYEGVLLKRGLADFSHLLLWTDDLLRDDRVADDIGSGIRHLMVDEYQDVSYLQEQVLLKLADYHDNLAVVEDDDQGIFRFRGAMADGLAIFEDRFPHCTTVTLDVNHRSHPGIVRFSNRLISGLDGDDRRGNRWPRHHTAMRPHEEDSHPIYPSVISVMGFDIDDEAGQLADMVNFLWRNRVIADYSQVALLMHSVKPRHSRPYLSALRSGGIPAFCPDAGVDRVLSPNHGATGNRRFPKGHVFVTTMHRSKGLERPVTAVVCGGFMGGTDGLDNVVRRYTRHRRPTAGPVGETLDRFHQFYVGCTRAQGLLILTASQENPPSSVFDHVWADLPRWAFMDPAPLAEQRFGRDDSRNGRSVSRSITVERLEHLTLRSRRSGQC